MATFSVSKDSKQKQETGVVEKAERQDFEDIDWASKLAEAVGVGRDEAEALIEDKKDEYDGLVTLDSAAAILVGREHGVELTEDPELNPELAIENIVPDMSSVELRATVSRVFSSNSFDGGQVRSAEIRDSTGETQLTVWDEDCPRLDHLEEGDTVKIVDGYTKQSVSDWQKDNYDGVPAVQVGDSTRVIKCGEEGDEEIIEAE